MKDQLWLNFSRWLPNACVEAWVTQKWLGTNILQIKLSKDSNPEKHIDETMGGIHSSNVSDEVSYLSKATLGLKGN